jgi:putative nucleotidyltransferase with HDIG domain
MLAYRNVKAIKWLQNLFKKCESSSYIGENISITNHQLQAAYLAQHKRPNDREFIIAALLHDLGHMEEIGEKMDNYGIKNHEDIGATIATDKLFLTNRVGRLIKSHVPIKRYLCHIDSNYEKSLTEASRQTLKLQGGAMTKEEANIWKKDPDLQEYILLRKIDDLAKDPYLKVPPFEKYVTNISILQHTFIL